MALCSARKRRQRLFRWLGIVVLCHVGGLATRRMLNPSVSKDAKLKGVHQELEVTVSPPSQVTVDEDVSCSEALHWNSRERKTYIVQAGDNLYKILKTLDVSRKDLGLWGEEVHAACRPEDLQVGDLLEIDVLRGTQDPVRFQIRGEKGERRLFLKQENEWVCRIETPPTFTRTETAQGIITETLYNSCLDQGVPPEVIMDLADLFAYQVDFTSDSRTGDRFAVLYEITEREGHRIKAGPIRAAQLMIAGRIYQAYFYELPDGSGDYYDAQGRSLRKMFLKAPLSYRRISSTYTHCRLHPVLRIIRPHLGIDYAAPAGTPVSAIGDSRVTRLGWNGGFGRYLEIQHDRVYKSSNGHLSRYAAGLKVGARVQRGDVIGYVGSSGLATGPHLDFRFYRNGKPVNFLKTVFPSARSIPPGLMADFIKKQRAYAAQLPIASLASRKSMESSHP